MSEHVRAAARRWARTWQSAWEAFDVEAIVALYADDALFSSQPFRTPYRGRDGVREYVSQAFTEEADVRAWFGEPVVEGQRAAVEWWAALRENGSDVTLAGTSALRFDDEGRVVEQRDTWNQADGRVDPPSGWGASRNGRRPERDSKAVTPTPDDAVDMTPRSAPTAGPQRDGGSPQLWAPGRASWRKTFLRRRRR
jgi:hypothetical protein